MRFLALCTLCALLPFAAHAEESGLQVGTGWRCTSAAPGLPKVCGSSHSTYQPPRVITQTVEVERPVPVPVPVYQPPVVQYVPTPVYVPQPVHRPHPPRRIHSDRFPFRR